MNAMLSTALPLPTCLERPDRTIDHRRHRIGRIELTDVAVDRFNRLLDSVGWTRPPLDCDRLVTAARELCSACSNGIAPACIRQRMRRVKAAVTMLGDGRWQPSGEARVVIQLVAHYVNAHDDLIPDTEPGYGRLDDAIVLEAAWPRIAEDVVAYVDFRRLGRLSTAPGAERARFDRAAWMQARLDEAALRALQRQIRATSYVSAGPAVFRVH
ncbi:MAG TPA: hypothetical protein VIG68_04870 [Lysobacter sp.]